MKVKIKGEIYFEALVGDQYIQGLEVAAEDCLFNERGKSALEVLRKQIVESATRIAKERIEIEWVYGGPNHDQKS